MLKRTQERAIVFPATLDPTTFIGFYGWYCYTRNIELPNLHERVNPGKYKC